MVGDLLCVSGKNEAHKHKKNPWDTGRGVPGTPAGTNRGLPAMCPKGILLLSLEKLTEKGNFAGTPARCPQGVFRNFM